jgi:hypothetical protein
MTAAASKRSTAATQNAEVPAKRTEEEDQAVVQDEDQAMSRLGDSRTAAAQSVAGPTLQDLAASVVAAEAQCEMAVLLDAIRTLCDSIAGADFVGVKASLSCTFPALAHAINHEEVEVRKVVVLALVNMYLKVGTAELGLYFAASLTETQRRLIQMYVGRIFKKRNEQEQ